VKPPLSVFSTVKGIYIPSGYDITYNHNGLIQGLSPKKGFPEKIKSRRVANLNSFPSSSCLITPYTEFSDMALIEVSRGCPKHCRFCAVGSVYQPFRIRNIKNLMSEIQPLIKKQTKIGILGSAVSDYPGLAKLIRAIIFEGGRLSISSLRANALTEEIVGLLKESNHKTVTIAPEAGSDRLRQVISKELTSQEIYKAVRILSRYKIPNIKLYFIIGLPDETDEDIKAIINMTKEIIHIYYKELKSKKWLNHVTLSVSPFVPKPFTVFQWHPFEQVRNLKRKLKIISNGLGKEKKVVVNYDLPKWGYVQTLLSRGDRRVGSLLVSAFEKNGDWTHTFRGTDINPDFFVYRERSFDEVLPWDIIDHGINKTKLWIEYQKALS
jgi:radical SAM superfamily enzyme YgiQ (UPF0313 family)